MKEIVFRKESALFAISLCLIFFVSSCAATKTFFKKSELRVETKMSETIFLEPTAPEQKIVYVDIRNTSDQDMPGLEEEIIGRIISNGFRITMDPNEATFILQGNVLQVERSDLDEANSLLGGGFEGVVEGATIGGVIGGVIAGDADEVNEGTVVGALAGGVGGFLFDTFITDVLYTMVTDIEIRERVRSGELVYQTQDTDAPQGSSTQTRQTLEVENVKWKIYRTRVVSVANKRNLEIEDAKPHLKSGLVKSIGGIF